MLRKRTIKINNIEWIIEERDANDTVFKNYNANGLCDSDNNVIYLARDVKPDFKRKVLTHELTHAFVRMHLLEVKKGYSEEELCEFVALYSEQINSITRDYFKR